MPDSWIFIEQCILDDTSGIVLAVLFLIEKKVMRMRSSNPIGGYFKNYTLSPLNVIKFLHPHPLLDPQKFSLTYNI